MNKPVSVVYLNGEFVPLQQAKVSVLDRGFLFGDGVYEVIPVFAGATFREREHLQRLDRSLQAIALRLPMSEADWHKMLQALLEKNQSGPVGAIYLQVTRGISEREHVFSSEHEATVFAMCKDVSDKRFADGVKAITHEDIRWRYCDIKAITLLPNVLLKQQAARDGAFEAILLRDGQVTEGAASNVFVVKDGLIKTPEKNRMLLPGITRDLVLELARQAGFECQETAVSEAELPLADEIWITSATVGIAPVIMLDGRPIADGKPGTYWQRIAAAYTRFRETGVAAD
ncbi:MAG: D-amino-acid transaminase [Gammaproteobacteria bacterium]